MICPVCNGKKEVFAFTLREGGKCVNMPCELCVGYGQVSDIHQAWIKEGKCLKDERIQRGITLRIEARRRGMRASVLSAMERGRIEPLWPTIME